MNRKKRLSSHRHEIARSALVLTLLFTFVACGGGSGEAHEDHGEHEEPGGNEEHAGEADHEEGVVELSPSALAAIDVQTATVELKLLGSELETTGMVGFDENRMAHVGSRIPGRIDSVEADLGAQVEVGALLASLDSIEIGQAKGAYLRARAHHEVSISALERESALVADGISTLQQQAEAQAAARSARADLEATVETLRLYGLASAQIAALTYDGGESSRVPIRAPLAGTIVERHASPGEYVTPDRTLFRVADLGHLWIWIDIYERDLMQVRQGDRVEVRADAAPDRAFEAAVSYIAAEVDPDTRTIRARVDVANDEHLLRPGMFARIRLAGSTEGAGAPLPVVPTAAVQRMGDESLIFVSEGGGRFEAREVELGRRSAGLVEVLSGVKPGEQVVVNGGFVLKSELGKGEMGGGHSH